MSPPSNDDLLDSNSPALVLRHPTPDECTAISNNTSSEWIDSLTLPLYLEESLFLSSVPLAKDGGMTVWILVPKHIPPGKRPIFCSCESFRKLSLTSDASGKVEESIVHGIASVFSPVQYRGQGYAKRMMRELIKELYTWQTDKLPCAGSTLYSDIGKQYYSNLGWQSNVTNSQVEIQPSAGKWSPRTRIIQESELEELCKIDEAIVRSHMAVPTEEFQIRFTIIPDLDHLGWHIGKEDFATRYLFGKSPNAKGVIVGSPGTRVWATWVHRYYGRPDDESARNVLYILRLVVESDQTATRLRSDSRKRKNNDIFEEQCRNFKDVIQAAQAEAAEWKLNVVKLWDPTPLVLDLLAQSQLQYVVSERQEENIASLLWYNCDGNISNDIPFWVNNEHYAWQ